MRILGIGFLSESSVALINNGKIEFAISEERLNRKKNWWGNPFKAINFVLSNTNKKLKDINYFATHGLSAYSNDVPSRLHFELLFELLFGFSKNYYIDYFGNTF